MIEMLVNFKFKSFKKETIFSMEVTTDNSYKDLNTFSINKKLLLGE